MFLALATLVALGIQGCSGSRILPDPQPAPDLRVRALEISPRNATMRTGQSRQFAANTIDFDGNPHQVKPIWTSSQGAINADGHFTAPLFPGTVLIGASSNKFGTQVAVEVISRDDPNTYAIVPETVSVIVGTSVRFRFIARNVSGAEVEIPQPNWTVSAGSITETGIFTAPRRPGRVEMTVSDGKGLTIRNSLDILAGFARQIFILPSVATVSPGAAFQFTALLVDDFGNVVRGQVSWNATLGRVEQSGLYIAPNAATNEVAFVYASLNQITSVASVNVSTAGPPVRIQVLPQNPSIRLNQFVQFQATAFDAQSQAVALTAPRWTTDFGSITTTGLYTPPFDSLREVHIAVTDTSFADLVGTTSVFLLP